MAIDIGNGNNKSPRDRGKRWVSPTLRLLTIVANTILFLLPPQMANAAPRCNRISFQIEKKLEVSLGSWDGTSGPFEDQIEIGGGFVAELIIRKSGVFVAPKKISDVASRNWTVKFRPIYGGSDAVFFEAYGFQEQGGTGYVSLLWDLDSNIGTVAALTYYNDLLGPIGVNLRLTCRVDVSKEEDVRSVAGLGSGPVKLLACGATH